MSKRQGDYSESRERVLDAAEKLFMEYGYDRVSMRDIAAALGVRQAALYYHAPDGKSQLFMMVVERNMLRQREGLEQAIAEAPADIRSQMTAVAHWLVENMPVDMIGMLRSDAAQMGTNGQQLFGLVARNVMGPITGIVVAAQSRGEIQVADANSYAGLLIASMNWTAFLSRYFPVTQSADEMIDNTIAILLHGASTLQ